MIRQEEVFYIGKVSKMRGLRGEVEILFTDDVFDRGHSEYLVLDMDGILVPYFWEEYRFKNDEIAIFKFQDIDADIAASHLVGHEVYYPFKEMPTDEETNRPQTFKAFIGFTVTDEQGHEIGRVVDVDDSSENVLLSVLSLESKEILLPLHEDFVTNYAPAARTIALRLPKGILNLNL